MPLLMRYCLKCMASLFWISVFYSIMLIRLTIISDCEPCRCVLSCTRGMQQGMFLAKLGFIQTRTLPRQLMKIISSLISKQPTFQYSTLKPWSVACRRQSWSAKGMSLISFSRRSTFCKQSSPLWMVEQRSTEEVLRKYFTLQMQGDSRKVFSGLSSACTSQGAGSFLSSSSLAQERQSCSEINCSSYSSTHSPVQALQSARVQQGLMWWKSCPSSSETSRQFLLSISDCCRLSYCPITKYLLYTSH